MATQAIIDEISNQNMNYTVKLTLSNSLNGEAKNVGLIFAYIPYLLLRLKTKLADSSVLNDDIIRLCVENLNSLDQSLLSKFTFD